MKAGRRERGRIKFWNYLEEGVPILSIRRKRGGRQWPRVIWSVSDKASPGVRLEVTGIFRGGMKRPVGTSTPLHL